MCTDKTKGTAVAKKILVADDDVAIAELLVESLIHEGYNAQTAVQSLRFYDAVRDYKPDLILLDLMMPYLAGEDELRLMQLSPDTSKIPIIVITARPESDVARDEPTLRQLGVLHILYKPFELEQLISRSSSGLLASSWQAPG
jgi:DNA-binding response OmpR family regulator